ncbi:unnamed protein product [Mucor circinelloides]
MKHWFSRWTHCVCIPPLKFMALVASFPNFSKQNLNTFVKKPQAELYVFFITFIFNFIFLRVKFFQLILHPFHRKICVIWIVLIFISCKRFLCVIHIMLHIVLEL